MTWGDLFERAGAETETDLETIRATLEAVRARTESEADG